MTTRLHSLAFFAALAVLAIAGWWCVGTSAHRHEMRVQTVTVD